MSVRGIRNLAKKERFRITVSSGSGNQNYPGEHGEVESISWRGPRLSHSTRCTYDKEQATVLRFSDEQNQFWELEGHCVFVALWAAGPRSSGPGTTTRRLKVERASGA